jgi:membrane-bound ClpP family serine protease
MDFAALLVIAGILLIAAEFCQPGWVVPGVLGGVAFLYGAYQMPTGPLLVLLGTAALAMWAGWRGWPKAFAALAGGASIAAAAQLDVHWLTAMSVSAPSIVLYWLTTVAAKSLANKTIVG